MLCTITSVGRFTRAIVCAIVKVLPGAGDAEQHLMFVAPIEAFGQLADGAGLVARQLEIGDEGEAVVHGWHGN